MNIHGSHVCSGSEPISADDPKLKSAAHEFEASLLQELLKPLQEDPLFAPGGDSGLGDSADASDDAGYAGSLMSFGSEALAKAISERGGFGIATKILDHFRAVEKTACRSTVSKT